MALNPELKKEIEKVIREVLIKELGNLRLSDRYLFERAIQIADGKNIQLATGTGTKIGTAIGQKLGFYNTTPVDQPATGVVL